MNRPLTVVLASALAVSACGTTVGGEATVAPASSSRASTTPNVPAGLDPGQYPTTTRDVPSPSGDNAWIIEGNRMAEALVQVDEVDRRLTVGGAGLRSYPVLSGDQLSTRVPDTTARIFTRNRMRVGMTTTRGDDFDRPTVAVRIGLYRFDSPEIAAAVLEAITSSTQALPKVAIDGHAEVSAAEFTPGTVDGYRAEGPFVINVSGTAPTNAEAARFVAKAFDLQVPKTTAFSPTPVTSIRTLPGDKDGVLSRTLLQESTELTSLSNAYFGLEALLHRIRYLSDAAPYRKAGVDLVGEGAAIVYRTRDAAAATTMVAEVTADSRARAGNRPVESPAGLPQAQCTFRTEATSYICIVSAGRWVTTAGGSSLQLAREAVSAEYAILTKNP
ncbi:MULTISPECIES: hypothetical protein [Tsukamurella]|uniref:GerMN domain-containing protein n=2 Tax=Tsukamurella TaxID=2060 RepID=A0A5C5S6U7_9ACTN|nr:MULTISPECIES: hypothetical protein [Tsukamurella]NMD55131.1 hypothetical protein [Tsukamurella columbiensis]TWS30155.1 hypothetical protein FK530_06480 [Tsukamurella conjunctivitidis]